MAGKRPVISDDKYYGTISKGDYIDREWLPPDLGGGDGNTSRIFFYIDNYFDNKGLSDANAVIPFNPYLDRLKIFGVEAHPVRPRQEITYLDKATSILYSIKPLALRFRVYFKDIVLDSQAGNEFKVVEPTINGYDIAKYKDKYKLRLVREVIREKHIINGNKIYLSCGCMKVVDISSDATVKEFSKEEITLSAEVNQQIDVVYETIVLEGVFENQSEPISIPFNITMGSTKYFYTHRYMYIDYYPENLTVTLNVMKYWGVSQIGTCQVYIDKTKPIDVTDSYYYIQLNLTTYGIYVLRNTATYPTLYIYYYANHYSVSTRAPLNVDGTTMSDIVSYVNQKEYKSILGNKSISIMVINLDNKVELSDIDIVSIDRYSSEFLKVDGKDKKFYKFTSRRLQLYSDTGIVSQNRYLYINEDYPYDTLTLAVKWVNDYRCNLYLVGYGAFTFTSKLTEKNYKDIPDKHIDNADSTLVRFDNSK